MNKTSKGLNRYEIHLTDKLMEEIESIATMEGAKVHHISKKPIIRDTVISLLELGIKCVYEGVELPKKPNTPNTDINNRIDLTVLDSRIEDKLKPLYSLISELSDKLNRITDTDNSNDTDNINRIDLTVLTESEKKTNNELATIKVRLATLENMLATIADNELATISSELANDNELVGTEKTEDNLLGAILDNIKNEETTKESTLSECPNLPSSEELGHNIPDNENKPVNEDKPELTEEMVTQLLKKHKIPTPKDTPLVINNNELLYPFFTELLGKKVDASSISKVANKRDRHYLVPSIVWEYFSVDKVRGKWQWTRLK